MNNAYDRMDPIERGELHNQMDAILSRMAALKMSKDQLEAFWDQFIDSALNEYPKEVKDEALKNMAEVLNARAELGEHYEFCATLRDYNNKTIKQEENDSSNNPSDRYN